MRVQKIAVNFIVKVVCVLKGSLGKIDCSGRLDVQSMSFWRIVRCIYTSSEPRSRLLDYLLNPDNS
jgi:hypothetical protein